MSTTIKIELIKELLTEHFLSNEQVLRIINEGLMRFGIGDKVRAIVNIYNAKNDNGTVTAMDRQRQQYKVDFDGYDVWLYENEIELIKTFDKSAIEYAEGLLTYEDEPGIKCDHKLKLYVGLVEQFNYCTICGLKEDEHESN